MHAARRFARDYLVDKIQQGQRVLDVCCGDCWLAEHVRERGAVWSGCDLVAPRPLVEGFFELDLAPPPPRLTYGGFDWYHIAVTVYGTEHLLDHEAEAWIRIREALCPGGRFIWIGRRRIISGREMGRDDPLNGYSVEGVHALAMATGFSVIETLTAKYDGDKLAYQVAESNTMAVLMERA